MKFNKNLISQLFTSRHVVTFSFSNKQFLYNLALKIINKNQIIGAVLVTREQHSKISYQLQIYLLWNYRPWDSSV